MAWPSRQDYREALQACDVAFLDPELKNATAVCDNLGMPRAFSGQNATVFQMRNGSRTSGKSVPIRTRIPACRRICSSAATFCR